jgi:hypothetical protein
MGTSLATSPTVSSPSSSSASEDQLSIEKRVRQTLSGVLSPELVQIALAHVIPTSPSRSNEGNGITWGRWTEEERQHKIVEETVAAVGGGYPSRSDESGRGV